ncbi:hypothetical protein ACIQ57_14720 [Lysinibacillus xylanilyticus]|uniref:hypothetical protein n=1 Tax=Lysinibacillus xylanilyticus TaxID=582475 RepID=UPI0038266768
MKSNDYILLIDALAFKIMTTLLSRDRLELKMSGRDYGQLADGDISLLTFQGTRYPTFERHKKESSDSFALSFSFSLFN